MHSALTRKIYIAFMKEERLRGHSDTSVLPCLHKVFGFKPRLRTLTALAIKCPLFSESVEPASFKQIWLNIFESKMNWFTTSNDQPVVCPVMKRPAAKNHVPASTDARRAQKRVVGGALRRVLCGESGEVAQLAGQKLQIQELCGLAQPAWPGAWRELISF